MHFHGSVNDQRYSKIRRDDARKWAIAELTYSDDPFKRWKVVFCGKAQRVDGQSGFRSKKIPS